MDKTSEVSSIHSETRLTNNQTNQQETNETCCEVSCQTCQNHIPAAVSTSNSEKENLGDLNREYGFMAGAKDAKEKPDKQILILSMGLKTQRPLKCGSHGLRVDCARNNTSLTTPSKTMANQSKTQSKTIAKAYQSEHHA